MSDSHPIPPTPDDKPTNGSASQGKATTAYPLGVGSLRPKTGLQTPMGSFPSSDHDQNRIAVSLLIALDHRRTGLTMNEIALKYGLTAPAAASALSQSMNEMADALGSYRLTLDTPLPVTGPSPVRKSKGKRP